MHKRIFFSKIIIFISAVQLLNLSIYAQSFEALNIHETIGSINCIDSFTEYVAEIILNHKDAMPEYKKGNTHKDLHFHKNISIQLADDMQKPVPAKIAISATNALNTYYKTYSFIFFKEINPPPPKL